MEDKLFVSSDPLGFMSAYYIENHPPYGEEYIRKDALMEWLETLKAQSLELREEGCGDVFYGAQIALLEEIIDKIESL